MLFRINWLELIKCYIKLKVEGIHGTSYNPDPRSIVHVDRTSDSSVHQKDIHQWCSIGDIRIYHLHIRMSCSCMPVLPGIPDCNTIGSRGIGIIGKA